MSMLINNQERRIEITIPLTTISGKIRIKKRSNVFEYGLPHATRRDKFLLSNYVEWQIGYDVVVDDVEKLSETTLPHLQFIAYNEKSKALYELSELLFYLYKFGYVSKGDLKNVLLQTSESNFLYIEEISHIKRTHPNEKIINGIPFYESKVEYPLLVHKFLNYEIIAEIVVREKQRAIGTQAMLYLCIPITEINASTNLLGRIAEKNEKAIFIINASNAQVVLEMMKIFSMLSRSHCHDVRSIINLILTN